jgi:hypothetical protein
LLLSSAVCRIYLLCNFFYGPCFHGGLLICAYKLSTFGEGKNPKQIPPLPHYLLFHLGFLVSQLASMADANRSRLNLGVPTVSRGHGRPRGSKNKTAADVAGSSSSVPVKRRPGRPVGSKNKPMLPCTTPGPSASPDITSPPQPKIYSFFCIAGAQCHEI